jgi:hypothetical protein
MNEPPHRFQVAPLQDYQFHSKVPVLGAFIAGLRRAVYNVAARWGVQYVMLQQNEVNAQLVAQLQVLETRLQEIEERLIEQDRDLAMLARTAAEVDIRQRYLARALTQQDQMEEHDATGRSDAA